MRAAVLKAVKQLGYMGMAGVPAVSVRDAPAQLDFVKRGRSVVLRAFNDLERHKPLRPTRVLARPP